jgi:TIGR03009 family protein
VFLASTTGLAQPADSLAQHLAAWEARQKQVTSLSAEFTLTKKNLLHRKESIFTGLIQCMKPNLARLQFRDKANPADEITHLLDGKSAYEFEGSAKRVTQHRLPTVNLLAPRGADDDVLLAFISGSLTASEAAKRFDLRLLKEEEWYVHIEVKPRRPKDLQEFESMTLVLFGPKTAAKGLDYLPAVVVLRNNNGQSEEQWTLDREKIVVNSDKVTAESFKFVAPPGWQVFQAPATAGLPRK